jgi:hypothetical protein
MKYVFNQEELCRIVRNYVVKNFNIDKSRVCNPEFPNYGKDLTCSVEVLTDEKIKDDGPYRTKP